MDVQQFYLWWVSPRVSTALLARSWRTSGGADAAHNTTLKCHNTADKHTLEWKQYTLFMPVQGQCEMKGQHWNVKKHRSCTR